MDIIHNAIGYYYSIDNMLTLSDPFDTMEEALDAGKAELAELRKARKEKAWEDHLK